MYNASVALFKAGNAGMVEDQILSSVVSWLKIQMDVSDTFFGRLRNQTPTAIGVLFRDCLAHHRLSFMGPIGTANSMVGTSASRATKAYTSSIAVGVSPLSLKGIP
ncbi:hypothetical protein AMTR_s00085p00093690 [Amborella trichopoda]|uniref:Uncharacterized protein n=1 Tax=Amborella trichopoda TaxID=13333 RepID=W1P441_AMBTC|nr:hypothetical protein AMTR_s00085p00093690 [Amborella trichopoda]